VAYSLYLSHKIVFHAVQTAAPHWPTAWQAAAPLVAGLLALAMGAALYGAVERPFLRLRDRWPARQAGRSEPEAAAAEGGPLAVSRPAPP
jgi:peptidoglycan/LPS O-acetylase OafA/YrhL